MNTSFVYVGEVEIQLQRGDKKYMLYSNHNAGNSALFDLFAKVMAGQIDAITQSDLPKYLKLMAINPNEQEYQEIDCFKDPIVATKYVSQSSEGSFTTVEGIVYGTNMIDISPYASYSFVLRLSSDNAELAQISVPYDVFSRIQKGVQLLITWKLKVENQVE